MVPEGTGRPGQRSTLFVLLRELALILQVVGNHQKKLFPQLVCRYELLSCPSAKSHLKIKSF